MHVLRLSQHLQPQHSLPTCEMHMYDKHCDVCASWAPTHAETHRLNHHLLLVTENDCIQQCRHHCCNSKPKPRAHVMLDELCYASFAVASHLYFARQSLLRSVAILIHQQNGAGTTEATAKDKAKLEHTLCEGSSKASDTSYRSGRWVLSVACAAAQCYSVGSGSRGGKTAAEFAAEAAQTARVAGVAVATMVMTQWTRLTAVAAKVVQDALS